MAQSLYPPYQLGALTSELQQELSVKYIVKSKCRTVDVLPIVNIECTHWMP